MESTQRGSHASAASTVTSALGEDGSRSLYHNTLPTPPTSWFTNVGALRQSTSSSRAPRTWLRGKIPDIDLKMMPCLECSCHPIPVRFRLKREFHGIPALHILLDAPLEPPVTVATLSELDMSSISQNEILRHNLNFETKAQFWPNYNTQLGRQRKTAARMYFAAVEIELMRYMRPSGSDATCHLRTWFTYAPLNRLPEMFATIKDILKALLREEQAMIVEEVFDVDLLMQQLDKNTCDIARLGDFLADMLKSSCSPQRDGEVMEMAEQLKAAATNADPSAMVNGIEHLFSILETMKLVRLISRCIQ